MSLHFPAPPLPSPMHFKVVFCSSGWEQQNGTLQYIARGTLTMFTTIRGQLERRQGGAPDQWCRTAHWFEPGRRRYPLRCSATAPAPPAWYLPRGMEAASRVSVRSF